MLGRTANGLYWMYRYLERAENTSRLVETGQRLALTRLTASDDEWRSVLHSAGVWDAYQAENASLTKDAAIDWMLRSPKNPSSVKCCLEAARSNARSVRTALTEESWEAVNGAYIEVKDLLSRKLRERDLPQTLSRIRRHTALVRGTTHGTMLRNDIYDFVRIGTFLERADNTARILDVKYYVLLPTAFGVGSSIDSIQWETILRSNSARSGYRAAYGNAVRPREVAHFLILDRRMPRSLAFCVSKIRDNLAYIAEDYGSRQPSHDLADDLHRACAGQDIDVIINDGLHEYLQDFVARLGGLGRQIEIDYRFTE
ncbi:MAG: alpha-E domain-containing protein [Pseudomonadota bacterium]